MASVRRFIAVDCNFVSPFVARKLGIFKNESSRLVWVPGESRKVRVDAKAVDLTPSFHPDWTSGVSRANRTRSRAPPPAGLVRIGL